MDALVPAFIVAALIEFGDRTQLLAILLSKRFGRPGAVLAGIALGALLNMAIGVAAGIAIAGFINHTAIMLMTGLALIFAGVGAPFRVKPPESVDGWRIGAFASSLGVFFLYALGDKTQFVAVTFSAGNGYPILTAIGAAAGTLAANVPAVILGDRWPEIVPLRPIRIGIGIVLVLAGIILAVQALGLV